MLRERLKRRAARRRAKSDAQASSLREATYALVREVAGPVVEAGAAQLEWTEPTAHDDWFAHGGVRLVPKNAMAAAVEVFPDIALVTLLVGPRGHAHEVVVDPEGRWRDELRACLEAVVAGRYREELSSGRVSRHVLTMTFQTADGDDIVVKHHDLSGSEPDGRQQRGERRFAGYV